MQASVPHLDHRLRELLPSKRHVGRRDAAARDEARRRTALVLIALTTILAAVLCVTLGADVAPAVLYSLPVAFPLMWWSATYRGAGEVD